MGDQTLHDPIIAANSFHEEFSDAAEKARSNPEHFAIILPLAQHETAIGLISMLSPIGCDLAMHRAGATGRIKDSAHSLGQLREQMVYELGKYLSILLPCFPREFDAEDALAKFTLCISTWTPVTTTNAADEALFKIDASLRQIINETAP